MANLVKKLTKRAGSFVSTATRASANPLYKVTDKIVEKAVPGYGSTITNFISRTSDPLSSTNKTLTSAALTAINPFDSVSALKQTASALNSATKKTTATTATQKTVPDRSSYSASASSNESARAAIMAKRLAEQKKTVPDRDSYSVSASANETVRNIAKTSNEIANNSNGMQTAEQQKDAANPEQVAEKIVYMFPDDVSNMRYAAGATGADAMNEQYLPEIYIQSDYKKYLILGGFALLGIFIWKKIK